MSQIHRNFTHVKFHKRHFTKKELYHSCLMSQTQTICMGNASAPLHQHFFRSLKIRARTLRNGQKEFRKREQRECDILNTICFIKLSQRCNIGNITFPWCVIVICHILYTINTIKWMRDEVKTKDLQDITHTDISYFGL